MKYRSGASFFLAGWLFVLVGCGGGSTGSGGGSQNPPPASEVITITTASLLPCVLSVPFSVALQQTGAKTAVTWSIVSGSLPDGLMLDAATGVISGTPTNLNSPSATIQAADSGAKTSKSIGFPTYQKFTISPISPPAAHTNVPYSLQLTAQTGVSSWSLISGQMPPGLTFPEKQGGYPNIVGTPTQTGTFSFTAQATDMTVPQIATVDITIKVDSKFLITKNSLKVGGEGRPYSDSFQSVNGVPPLQWSTSGTFAPGLSVDTTTGAVAGTPTKGGHYVFTIHASDSSPTPHTDSAQVIFDVESVPKIIFASNPAYLDTYYDADIGVSGGNGNFTLSMTSGSLPPGLQLYANREITGFPTQLGTYNFTIQATDTSSPPYTASSQLSVTVVPSPLVMQSMVVNPVSLNAPYHSQIALRGGTQPYSWSVPTGQLPPGVQLDSSTGYLDGTPTQEGSYSFAVKGTDSSATVQTSTATVVIDVLPGRGRNDSIATATPLGNSATALSGPALSLSPFVDPIDAHVANPDTDFYRLVAVGGSFVHVQTAAQGLVIDTVVELLDQSGQQLSACKSPAYTSPCMNDDISVADTNSALDFKVPGTSATQTTFYLHVLDWRGDARPEMTYSLQISGVVDPLFIFPDHLQRATTVNKQFHQQLDSWGSTGNITWSVDGGALPPGINVLSITADSGELFGTPTSTGFYSFAIKATDSASPPKSARMQYYLQVVNQIALNGSGTLPNACLNKAYSTSLNFTGGAPPLNFIFWPDSGWPLVFDPNTRTFSGKPAVAGTFTGKLNVGDISYGSLQVPVSLTVAACN